MHFVADIFCCFCFFCFAFSLTGFRLVLRQRNYASFGLSILSRAEAM